MQEPFSNLPATQAEARKRGFNRFFTGVPCLHGHVAPRYVSTTNCIACQVEHARRNGGWKARPDKAEYLARARKLIVERGGALLSSSYVSAKSDLAARCAYGHEFSINYDNLKHGRWCGACKTQNHVIRMAAKFRTVEELGTFASRVHGGDCLATRPVGVLTKVLWKCRIGDHPPFLATSSRVMAREKGTWCPACDTERRRRNPPNPPLPIDRVEKYVTQKGGTILVILGDGLWKGGRTRLRLQCARGHHWTTTASSLVHSHSWCNGGCQSRFGERITRAILETTFAAEFPQVSPAWMPRGPSDKHRLTLDGYNDDLKLAFEYQGPHHDRPEVIETDRAKQAACRKHGVRLLVVAGIKQPFPAERVLAQVRAAMRAAAIGKRPKLPAHDLFEHELKELRCLAEKKGGQCLATVFRGWDSQYEWTCSNPSHPPWAATRYQIRSAGSWCGHCAGNGRLGIDGLRRWGLDNGLGLIDTEYGNAGSLYDWRCLRAGHTIRRSRGNIQQSLRKGYPACTKCGPGTGVSANVRTQRANDFAKAILPIIMDLKCKGFASFEALATQLNETGVATSRGLCWYASTVRNVMARSGGE